MSVVPKSCAQTVQYKIPSDLKVGDMPPQYQRQQGFLTNGQLLKKLRKYTATPYFSSPKRSKYRLQNGNVPKF